MFLDRNPVYKFTIEASNDKWLQWKAPISRWRHTAFHVMSSTLRSYAHWQCDIQNLCAYRSSSVIHETSTGYSRDVILHRYAVCYLGILLRLTQPSASFSARLRDIYHWRRNWEIEKSVIIHNWRVEYLKRCADVVGLRTRFTSAAFINHHKRSWRRWSLRTTKNPIKVSNLSTDSVHVAHHT